jgi:formylglycine-generating enzyme required for sulfatase activity
MTSTRSRETRDAYVGLDNPTHGEWAVWHRAMLDERESALSRARFDPSLYVDASTAWSDTTFRQVFLFMYDASFYDGENDRYRARELVEHWSTAFGRVDSVLLWHAYPRLGFDSRTQFDFYRDMPGGLARLRADVTDVFHARGIRVFIDYNPWDAGAYDELAEVAALLDADGIMLDTMTEVPDALADAVRKRKTGVVFAPELRPRDADLARARQSWAQWYEVGDERTPSIYRHRWLVPKHRQLAIRRWDTSRRQDIGYSFFNGSGLILWDNIFGSWNPYSREDRRLIAETAAVLDCHQELFVDGDWLPLVPTGTPGLDANRWTKGERAIVTLRNRTKSPLPYRVPPALVAGQACVAFWGDKHELLPGDTVVIAPEGVQAIVADDRSRAERALAHFQTLSRRADVALPTADERCPPPRLIHVARATKKPATHATSMMDLPAGAFDMTIRHERRECGCYPLGATDDAMWGWFYKDVITHHMSVTLPRLAIRSTAVTNAEFLAFVHEARYRPRDNERFLAHIGRMTDGSLPTALSSDQGALPVTFVSLDDARAYAGWCGQRLPTEAEWQWAAEGAGLGHRYPWGNDDRTFASALRTAFDASTATPQGVMGLSGNAWELTESEHTDGHTRFVMLRGGVYLPPGESEWLVARGARPNDHHAKYILLSDGFDRSEAISFRTVSSPA